MDLSNEPLLPGLWLEECRVDPSSESVDHGPDFSSLLFSEIAVAEILYAFLLFFGIAVAEIPCAFFAIQRLDGPSPEGH